MKIDERLAFLILGITLTFTRSLSLKQLRVLALAPSKGEADGRACQTAIDMAFQGASQSGILLKYILKPVFRDEGAQGSLAPKALIEFLNEVRSLSSRTFIAPVIVGPWSNCQYITNLSSYFKMIIVSYGCLSSSFTANRKNFRNLYRTAKPAEQSSVAIIYFVKYVLKLREINIVGNPSEPSRFQIIKELHVRLLAADINLSQIEFPFKLDGQLFDKLKNGSARVVYIDAITVPYLVKFLCRAHDNGILGPRFVFVVQSFPAFNSDHAEKFGCSKEVFDKQLSATFWVGQFYSAVEPTGNSSFGYNALEFDGRLVSWLNGSIPLDFSIRHACHDAAMQAILALDRTDGLLRQNMTLRRSQDQKLVFNILNQSLAESDFQGLRVGRSRYSSRLEFDIQPLWISQIFNGKLKLLYKLNPHDDQITDLFDLDQYSVKMINKPIWMTNSGQPPKDLSSVIHLQYFYPQFSYFRLISAALLLSIGQFALAYWSMTSRKIVLNTSVADLLATIGALLLNVTAIACVTSHSDASLISCYAKIICLIMSLSLINGSLCFRTLFVSITSKRLSTQKTPLIEFSSNKVKAIVSQQGLLANLRHDQFVLFGTLTFLFISSACTVGWLLGAGGYEITRSTSNVQYDGDSDYYFDVTTLHCTANSDRTFWLILFCLHFMFLLAALISTGSCEQHPLLAFEFCLSRTSVTNNLLTFAAVGTLTQLMDTNQTSTRISLHAFSALMLSFSTSLIITMPTINLYLFNRIKTREIPSGVT